MFKCCNFDFDVFEFEDTIAVFRIGGGEFHIERQSLSTKEDIHETSILDIKEILASS